MEKNKVFKVLIVDDNLGNRILVAQTLNEKGFHVEVAQSGHEAFSALNESQYDILLMGCDLPGMDGFETAELIRDSSLFSQSQIPIVAWATDFGCDVQKKCQAAGIDDCIATPISEDLLLSKVKYWIQRTQT